MVDIISERLWTIFEDLIPPPDKDKKDEEDDEKKAMSDVAKQAISIEDVVNAMKDLSDGKTPGED